MRVLNPNDRIEFFCKRLCGGTTISDPESSIFIPKLVELGIMFLNDDNKHVRHEIGQTLIIIVTVVSAEMDQTPVVSKKRDKESLKLKIRDYYQRLERLNSHFPRTGPRYSISSPLEMGKIQARNKGGKIYIEGPSWNDGWDSDLDTSSYGPTPNTSHNIPPSKRSNSSLSIKSQLPPGPATNITPIRANSSDIAVI